MITTELKQRIVTSLKAKQELFSGSDAMFAKSIGINKSQFSRIKSGELEQVISDGSWISLARMMNISSNASFEWKTARTPVFEYVTKQLAFCQENSSSRMLCDVADIGKTYTAKEYTSTHRNVVYVDCSQYKTKQKLIRFIAQSFGVNHTGKYADVYADLVYFLVQTPKALIILDEAGDLDYSAFLELKALWNATERGCGWYMMGADGLREKIRRSIDCKKVGYAEIFSRYGSRYQQASPDGTADLNEFKMAHAAMIIALNFPKGTDTMRVIKASDNSLRRIYDERIKLDA